MPPKVDRKAQKRFSRPAATVPSSSKFVPKILYSLSATGLRNDGAAGCGEDETILQPLFLVRSSLVVIGPSGFR